MKTYKPLLGIGLALVVLLASTLPFAIEDVSGATVSGSGSARKLSMYNTTAVKSLKVIVNYSTFIGLDRDYYNVTIIWIPIDTLQNDEWFNVSVAIQEVNKTVAKKIDFDATNANSVISFTTNVFIEEDVAYYNVTLGNFTGVGDYYAGTTEISTSSMTGMIMGIMPVLITLAMLSLILGMIGGITKMKGFNMGGK